MSKTCLVVGRPSKCKGGTRWVYCTQTIIRLYSLIYKNGMTNRFAMVIYRYYLCSKIIWIVSWIKPRGFRVNSSFCSHHCHIWGGLSFLLRGQIKHAFSLSLWVNIWSIFCALVLWQPGLGVKNLHHKRFGLLRPRHSPTFPSSKNVTNKTPRNETKKRSDCELRPIRLLKIDPTPG